MARIGVHLGELTAREREILVLTADGRSAPDIAGHLHVTAATVNTNLLSSFEKLGVRDRHDAVAVALQSGLLEHHHQCPDPEVRWQSATELTNRDTSPAFARRN